MDTSEFDNNPPKAWNTDIERLETITKKYSKRQQTAIKQLRKRIDNLSILLAGMNNPCRKDLCSLQHHLKMASNHLSVAYRATLEFERLGRSDTAESAILKRDDQTSP